MFCVTNNSYQGPILEDHDCPINLKIVVTRKKSNATLNLKVKTMDGLVQRTIGVLCCIYHIITSSVDYCEDSWNTLKIPLAPSQRAESFQVMFVGDQHIVEQVELTRMFERQDATGITSASADSRINFPGMMMSLWVRTLCLCLVFTTIFLSVSPFSVKRFQRFNNVIVNFDQCWQSKQMDTECN